ncbi:heavy metal translocating P-type ATPase [Haploplasma axanthum]|nr:heavy metal translocating P-type ATPase [Haploplasma axanthum]
MKKEKHNHDHHDHEHNNEHEEGHSHEDHHGHDHKHGKHTLIISAVLFFVGVILHIVSRFITNDTIMMILNLIALVFAGTHVIFEGIEDTISSTIRKKKFTPNVHILMTLAAIGAVIIGDYKEAALLIIIFAGAHYLEEYAEGKSKKEIKKLLKLNPTKARRILEDGSIEIIDVNELKIGDKLKVLNGDQIPTDGIIISGESDINEASITGESIPRLKSINDEVFGSTMNGNGTFEMQVTKDSENTVFSKIVKLVGEAQTNISKTAVLIKKIEPIYVTAVILLTPFIYLFGRYILNWGSVDSFYRTMVFLIVASPCALAATDIPATLSAISNLAKNGVLFKGGSYLSNLSEIGAVAFDKTGTLTEGKPVVTDVYFAKEVNELDKQKYLDILVSMESKSNHPLATAIINYFDVTKKIEVEAENIIGVGLIANYKDKQYKIGKPTSYKTISKELVNVTHEYSNEGKTVVYFGVNEEVVLLIAIQDIPKESSKVAIDFLNKENVRTVMITGDAVKTGEAIGNKLGINEVIGNVLPEDKANIIKDLKTKYGVVAMLGDGVNDAPALVTADIGIAMGDGTDIAIDVADGVLMKNDLTKFVYTYKTSKKLRRIVWENIIFSMLVVLFLITINFFGKMEMPLAVLVHEGSTIVVILNGLRLLKRIKV